MVSWVDVLVRGREGERQTDRQRLRDRELTSTGDEDEAKTDRNQRIIHGILGLFPSNKVMT